MITIEDINHLSKHSGEMVEAASEIFKILEKYNLPPICNIHSITFVLSSLMACQEAKVQVYAKEVVLAFLDNCIKAIERNIGDINEIH